MNIKYFALATIALTSLTAGSLPSYAEEGKSEAPKVMEQEGNGGPRADKSEKRRQEMFEKTDINKDGFLSKEEMEATQRERLDEMFSNADADKDGKLTAEELKAGREKMREKMRERFKDGRGHGSDDHGPDDKPKE